MRAMHLIHEVMGEPQAQGVSRLKKPEVCAICGQRRGDVDVRKVVGGDFTNHDLLRRRDSPAVCEACAWAKSHAPLRRKYWMASRATGLMLFEWNQAAKFAEVLMSPPPPPFTACLTLSGKKILVLRAPVNIAPGPYLLQVEEQALAWDPADLLSVLEACREMRRGKITESQIISGHYRLGAIHKFGRQRWQELEATVAPWRGSGHLPALTTLARKDKKEEEKACKPKKQETQPSLSF